MASSPLGNPCNAQFTRFRRAASPCGPATRRPRRVPLTEKKETMPDLAYLALTVVCFIVLALVVKAVEKL
ncbi:hypothetical protein J2S68_001889 [Glycomyces algeriensis]|uniref:Uncharacterized protein n=1 Tax=Glycomyces algeriensis TaxID=256037 RepID=A0A9W6GA40_9ACTN|nr:hypothetical protein [Glycomyces algeriensis]GLI43052.1 hypothetical protein GALLR39Z86_29020 [Glycomyces algeriensis]